MKKDKNLVRQFFRVTDAYSMLNLAMLQYTAQSSTIAHRIQKILRKCYKEHAMSSTKEAFYDSKLKV